MKVTRVSIFILNYNGIALMQECLPTLLEAAKKSVCPVRLVVIDNRSTDASVEFIKNNFPAVEVFAAPSNDFLCSFNGPAARDSSEVLLLLNNDIKVEPGFLHPLIRLFEEKEDAFMAGSLCWDFSKTRYEGGLSVLIKKWGMWGTRSVFPKSLTNHGDYLPTASIGAALAIRRDRFVELQGYDRLYLPGILEDLDLCYRGWKRGWKGYFVPESVIYHKGQASFAPAFGNNRIRKLASRNTFLFIWKNISDPALLSEHLLCLAPRLLFALCRGDFAFIAGLFEALAKIGGALSRRKQAGHKAVVSDSEILKIFKSKEYGL